MNPTTEPIDLHRLPPDVEYSWPGQLPGFQAAREGGPGKPKTLIIWTAISVAMFIYGSWQMDKEGIDSFGPALIFLSILVFFSLLLWVIIKEWARPKSVLFFYSHRGVGILPSQKQAQIDQNMKFISRMVFLLTWKGGQWSDFRPYTTWKSVKKVTLEPDLAQMSITGGAWDIRLCIEPENFDWLKEQILQHVVTSGSNYTLIEK